MNKYLVTLSPEKPIPKEGWDVALVNFRLYVYAKNAKEAREIAVRVTKNHKLFCKVTYIRKLKGE